MLFCRCPICRREKRGRGGGGDEYYSGFWKSSTPLTSFTTIWDTLPHLEGFELWGEQIVRLLKSEPAKNPKVCCKHKGGHTRIAHHISGLLGDGGRCHSGGPRGSPLTPGATPTPRVPRCGRGGRPHPVAPFRAHCIWLHTTNPGDESASWPETSSGFFECEGILSDCQLPMTALRGWWYRVRVQGLEPLNPVSAAWSSARRSSCMLTTYKPTCTRFEIRFALPA